jgi:putative lipoic acid-binding regulatory protein
VLSVFNQHATGFSEQDVLVKDSRNGTFQSITITIEAQSEEQLRLIHQDLMDTGLVSMVL